MSDPHGIPKPSGLRPVKTATESQTIWSIIPEREFRQNLVTLERRTNAVPIAVLNSSVVEDGPTEFGTLPLSIERSLADDLAYLAAVTEGAQSVAAVCLEQHVGAKKLVVRVAGMDVVDQKVRDMLSGIAAVLESAAFAEDVSDWEERVFAMIIEQHSQKLLGRMRSVKWTKPAYLRRTHKKPLVKDFENVAHRVQHVYPRKGEWKVRKTLAGVIAALSKEYERFESGAFKDELLQELYRLVKATYDFCMVFEVRDFASRIASIDGPTPQIAAAVKTLRQLEKIGAYWRIAKDLITTAKKFPDSFRRVELEYVIPYAEAETDIAYESWAKIMHVHAEVQLMVEYAIRQQRVALQSGDEVSGSTIIWPRTIGTSKYLCYLCYLFMREHGGFGQDLSSHGRLFDQWTVPDLREYDSGTRDKLADVLCKVNQCVENQIADLRRDVVWRPEPMTSRQNLLGCGDEVEKDDGTAVEELEQKLSAL
ncbi:uncharacterized protein RCC_05099 [Ramularia collo-cygni]|uniref:Uncharacterized protein n=1 Tax=Ramularia collo-cygni TaxID=112498 RepID=A0A2D3VF30_9PEZI|nr:uncharacterized protein RCC_05099 [Ramularia collo-cygni]CZT19253.1 uncharacterized protein RCC_05099 [Ramularia collo-cygni]